MTLNFVPLVPTWQQHSQGHDHSIISIGANIFITQQPPTCCRPSEQKYSELIQRVISRALHKKVSTKAPWVPRLDQDQSPDNSEMQGSSTLMRHHELPLRPRPEGVRERAKCVYALIPFGDLRSKEDIDLGSTSNLHSTLLARGRYLKNLRKSRGDTNFPYHIFMPSPLRGSWSRARYVRSVTNRPILI
jgi:hypothetical protein